MNRRDFLKECGLLAFLETVALPEWKADSYEPIQIDNDSLQVICLTEVTKGPLPTIVHRFAKKTSIYDMMLSCDCCCDEAILWVLRRSPTRSSPDQGRDIFRMSLNARASFRWVSTPTHNYVMEKGDTLEALTNSPLRVHVCMYHEPITVKGKPNAA